MAPPNPLLAVRARNAAEAQVVRLVFGPSSFSEFPLGDSLGPGTIETPVAYENRTHSTVLQFGNKVYCYQEDKIHCLDPADPTGDWNVVYTALAQSTANPARHTGLHVIAINRVPALIAAYASTSNDVRIMTSLDGVTWNEVTP